MDADHPKMGVNLACRSTFQTLPLLSEGCKSNPLKSRRYPPYFPHLVPNVTEAPFFSFTKIASGP